MAHILAAPSTQVFRRQTSENPEWAFDLQTAINKARPGDVVELLPGRFPIPATLSVSGTAKAPIVLRGASSGQSVLCGGTTRDHGRHSGMEPLDGDHAVLKLIRANHIVLEGLFFEDPWPTAIYMRSCTDVMIRNCHAVGGRYFIYARQHTDLPTERITLDALTWVQDADHDMWSGRVSWPEVKAQRGHFDASFFNGAMFGSFDINGGVTIRNCAVAHAFNVIRMDVRDGRFKRGKNGLSVSRNCDVAIYNNSFAFVRDNAIEPEAAAQNWRVFNNRFYNVHAAFSLDGVASRDMLFVSNTILNDHKPGLLGQQNQGGKVFKFLKSPDKIEKPRPRENLCSAFNSVLSRTSYAKKGATQHWLDANTAIGLFHADYPKIKGKPRPVFYKMAWHDGIKVQGMATNDTTFPEDYQTEKGDIDGFASLSAVFVPPDFERNPHDFLGGWNGRLDKSAELKALTVETLTLSRADGPDVVFPAGLNPGAQDLDALGLTDMLATHTAKSTRDVA
ncbi:right-handed parallel beta-helix repeat-containing protein [Falsiphaeobacter marinintestinus]|uniref:right-handed parallel beta-helix repeat-containing protein n=1 Tax=Falsiphaeobacter marinintestinus TaxID=1492905 RepID=UPI0011B6546C|nr:right-handed parallel beta-helix repeat-containing protein [Phaeobacter marinintestinus]